MIKLMYKPFSIVAGVLGGVLAGVIFKQVWKLAAHEEEAPTRPTCRRAGAKY